MSIAVKADELLGLAKSRTAADRERLLMAVIDICDAGDHRVLRESASIQELLSSIFMALVVETERDIRRRLAEKLSTAEWAPAALINVLALDEIEIARPIIAASPVLQDADLVRLLVEATLEHQIEIARRPNIGRPVIAEILARQEPAVLTALAGNAGVHLSTEDLARLVRAARKVAALGSALAKRPELTVDLARELYVWVGQSLRQALAETYDLDVAALETAVAESVREAHAQALQEPPDAHAAAPEGDEREAMERRLVSKLKDAGQLRPGYLLRALRERKLSLFVNALSMLGEFELAQVRRAIDSDRSDHLALACAAVGVDRGAFPSLLRMVRELNEQRPGAVEGEQAQFVASGLMTAGDAAAAFRKAMQPAA